MWSISSSNHGNHVGTHLGEFASYIARHRYVFVALAILFTLIVAVSVFILQSSAASQKAHGEAVSSGQQSSLSATVSNTSQEQVSPVTQPEPSNQPAHNEASVSHSGSETTVKVNGETIPLPQNGSVHRTIQNDNGTTKVDVSVKTDSSGSNMSLNSTSVNVNGSSASSRSSVSINNSQ